MNTTESEVIRKGLQLMALYTQDGNAEFVIKNETGDQKVVIL
ncbi:hypothetical protein [Nodularia spumigena]|nr:hypothetical protein [Nodularia spumigena]